MDDTEFPEGRNAVVGSKKKLNQTQRNVILGVATVAGLGVVGKLLAVLQQEKPTLQKDEDVETLEAVMREGKTRHSPLQAQVQRTKLANLDNDEPDHEVMNSKRNPNRSKFADSFSEIISEDHIAEEGEIFVNQDPVGRRDNLLNPNPREPRQDARHGSNSLKSRKGMQLSVRDVGGIDIKGLSHSNAPENGGKYHEEEDEDEDEDEDPQEHLSSSSTNPASKEFAQKESTNTSGSSEKLSSTQRKHRRASLDEPKRGRKSKAGGDTKAAKQKNSKAHAEASSDTDILFDDSSRWESVNDYKVLKSAASKLLPVSSDSSDPQMKEFRRERAETAKAQSIWDGKARGRKRSTEGSAEALLQLKASVVSSVSDAEETPEGVKVREVVRRSTLLPIPSGDESEVHSSVYNVRETEKGLTVEEVVTRTKLLPSKGDSSSLSEQQLLKRRTYGKKPSRHTVRRILPLLLQIVAVLATLFGVLLILYSRKRIPLPFPY